MKFLLNVDHYLPGDRYVEAGEEVGEGTKWDLPEGFVPSQGMTGLDEEGKRLIRERARKDDPMSEIAIRKAMGGKNAEIERLEKENEMLRASIAATSSKPVDTPPHMRTLPDGSDRSKGDPNDPQDTGRPAPKPQSLGDLMKKEEAPKSKAEEAKEAARGEGETPPPPPKRPEPNKEADPKDITSGGLPFNESGGGPGATKPGEVKPMKK